MRFTRALSAVSLIAALAACSSKKQAAGKQPDRPPEGALVKLVRDGVTLSTVPIAHATLLETLIPTTPAWLGVEARSADGRALELDSPDVTYRDGEIRLDVHDKRATLGVYRRAATNVPPEVARLSALPSPFLDGVSEVEVFTHPPERADPAAEAALEIERPGHALESIAPDELDALSERTPKPRIHGWALADVIGLASHEAFARVKVVGAAGSQTFTREQLADDATVIVLKRNNRGEYVLQVWVVSEQTPRLQVRGVTRIVLDAK